MARETVYFFSYENGPIKIGKATNVKARLAGVQTGCPFKLEILGFMCGPENLEKSLHDKFGQWRMNGEWFERNDDLLTFIEEHTYPPESNIIDPDTDSLKEQVNELRRLLFKRESRLRPQVERAVYADIHKNLTEQTEKSMWRWLVACQSLVKILGHFEQKGLMFSEEFHNEIRRVIDSVFDIPWRDSQRIFNIKDGDEKLEEMLSKHARLYVNNRYRDLIGNEETLNILQDISKSESMGDSCG